MDNNENRYDIDGLIDEIGAEMSEASELYCNYFTEMKAEIIKAREYASEKNWTMLERVVHNIKGVSASLCVDDVYEKALELDNLLKNNKVDDADTYMEELAGLLKDAKTYIKGYFETKKFYWM